MNESRYAGFWLRLIATVIDSIVLTMGAWLVELVVMGALYWMSRATGWSFSMPVEDGSLNPLLLQVVNAFIYFLISMPYFVIGHARYRTTLGKRLLSIYVVDDQTYSTMSWKQSWARFFASGLSYLPLLGGYIMVAFHPEKRALHDLLAGTVSVVYSPKAVKEASS